MALIGLTEAARLAGKDKATIHRAMKSGRLSYSVGEGGERQIDVAELERVFSIKSAEIAAGNQRVTGSNHSQLMAQLEAERIRVAGLQERLSDQREVIDDLRRRLDEEAGERRRTQAQLTMLLTDQRLRPDATEAQPLPQHRSGLLASLRAVLRR